MCAYNNAHMHYTLPNPTIKSDNKNQQQLNILKFWKHNYPNLVTIHLNLDKQMI